MNELISPDLLPFQMFEELKIAIQTRLDEIAQVENPIERSLLEMDVNRWEFELVLLNRTRIQKVSKFPQFFLKQQAESLSIVEEEFAHQFSTLRRQYLIKAAGLEQEDFDLLDENYPMPNMNEYVLFRTKNKMVEQLPFRNINIFIVVKE